MCYLRKIFCLVWMFVLTCPCKSDGLQKAMHGLDSIPERIAFEQTFSEGIYVLNQQPLIPDSNGIISQIRLVLPKFQKGIYYRPFSAKLAAGNRVEPLWFETIEQLDTFKLQKPRIDNYKNLGTFMMLKKENGEYLALLPLVSNRIGNTFSIRDNDVFFNVATYGSQTENVTAPLISYAQSKSPYEAVRLAWKQAMQNDEIKDNIEWRENKTYPEPYKYLGWCSWEYYKHNISEEIILDAINGLKSSDIPFRWVLIDDGYLDAKKSQLLSFGVDKKKFPHGWTSIISQKDEKIKWMGIWRNFNGYRGGVSPVHTMLSLNEYLVRRGSRYMPKISYEASNAFYNEMTVNTKNNGFDMIKVDFQSDIFGIILALKMPFLVFILTTQHWKKIVRAKSFTCSTALRNKTSMCLIIDTVL